VAWLARLSWRLGFDAIRDRSRGLVVQRILRHARLIVTSESYLKQFDIRVTEAMGNIVALKQKQESGQAS
jgi:hypothetical protein